MSKTILTLLAGLALATSLAVAQYQPSQNPPAQNPPDQTQPMPQTQQPPQQAQPPAAQRQTPMSSQELEAAFQKAFQRYPELADVKAKVADDKIELSGKVPSQADKDKVRRTAEMNAGGRKVVDEDLKVSGGENRPANPPPSAPPSTPPPSQ